MIVQLVRTGGAPALVIDRPVRIEEADRLAEVVEVEIALAIAACLVRVETEVVVDLVEVPEALVDPMPAPAAVEGLQAWEAVVAAEGVVVLAEVVHVAAEVAEAVDVVAVVEGGNEL